MYVGGHLPNRTYKLTMFLVTAFTFFLGTKHKTFFCFLESFTYVDVASYRSTNRNPKVKVYSTTKLVVV